MSSNRFLLTDDPKGRQIRRSSSLQLPLSKNNSQNPLIQAFSNLKNSTVSLYSNMSVTGFIGGRGSDSAVNLYTLMAKYRCCCGFCRLRIGSFVISLLSLLVSISVIIFMAFFNTYLTDIQREYLTVPTFFLMGLQLISSILMLVGIFADSHYFLLPFQLSCIFNLMGAMGLGLILLISADHGNGNSQLYPVFAACSMGLVAIYLWFLVICSMTFVMIRDKKRLIEAEIDFFEEPHIEPHIERVNSALF